MPDPKKESDAMRDAVSDGMETAKQNFEKDFNAATEKMSNGNFGERIEGFGEAIDAFGKLLNDTGTAIGKFGPGIGEDMAEEGNRSGGELGEALGGVTGEIVEGVSEASGQVAQGAAELSGDLFKAIAAPVKGLGSGLDNVGKGNFGDAVVDALNAGKDTGLNFGSGIAKFSGRLVGGAAEAGEGVLETGREVLEGMVEIPVDAVERALSDDVQQSVSSDIDPATADAGTEAGADDLDGDLDPASDGAGAAAEDDVDTDGIGGTGGAHG